LNFYDNERKKENDEERKKKLTEGDVMMVGVKINK